MISRVSTIVFFLAYACAHFFGEGIFALIAAVAAVVAAIAMIAGK